MRKGVFGVFLLSLESFYVPARYKFFFLKISTIINSTGQPLLFFVKCRCARVKNNPFIIKIMIGTRNTFVEEICNIQHPLNVEINFCF